MAASNLFRLAGLAGVAAGAALVVDGVVVELLLDDLLVARSVGVLAPILGLLAITGLYLWVRDAVGSAGLWAFVVQFVGLAGFVGISISVNYVLALLDTGAVDELLEGPTRLAFTVIAVVFITGAVWFGAALWRTERLPRLAIVLYVGGFVPRALANVLPETVVEVSQIVAAIGIAWLSYVLYSAHREQVTVS